MNDGFFRHRANCIDSKSHHCKLHDHRDRINIYPIDLYSNFKHFRLAQAVQPLEDGNLLQKAAIQGADMNIVLSFLNAAALVALVTFHFVGADSETEQVNVLTQPTHQLHQVPQLAMLNHLSQNPAMLANDSDEASSVLGDRSERWVF
ncbi:hypothetical protein [Pseudomonas sp. NA-150]|uniref:hypothetical protein n=1 Tax=Pseudomonas sp. NA-150 TaxID=3367525 RepID=UPI0037C8BE4D